MSYIHCPYCEIKEDNGRHYEALEPIDGKCPDCGAFIDVGQHRIDVNGYADIYNGVLSVIEDVVQQMNNLMDYLEVDTKIDGETPCIKVNTSEIVSKVFIPYSGMTSMSNFKKAIGVTENEVSFEIKSEQNEW